MNRKITAVVAAAGLLLAQNVNAATQTSTMGVSATVSTVCSVSANALTFGEVALSGATSNTTTITATCTNGGTYNVGLSDGANAAAGQRRLVSGENALNYELYSDSARAVRWGSTVGTDTVSGTGNGAAQTLTVYGEILAGQILTTGSNYADTVQVTITY
jgi:spore coat protein U-like protein